MMPPNKAAANAGSAFCGVLRVTGLAWLLCSLGETDTPMPIVFMPIVFAFFLPTVVIGAVLFLIVWLLTRRRMAQRRLWRFLVSCLAAFAVAPTSAPCCGVYCIVPASFTSLMILAPDPVRRAMGFMAGHFSLVSGSLIIFSIWSYFAERKLYAA